MKLLRELDIISSILSSSNLDLRGVRHSLKCSRKVDSTSSYLWRFENF